MYLIGVGCMDLCGYWRSGRAMVGQYSGKGTGGECGPEVGKYGGLSGCS